jgi:predicted ester cyclase
VLVLFPDQRKTPEALTSGRLGSSKLGHRRGSADARERWFFMTTLKTKLDRIPVEIFNQGKLQVIDELFAPEFTERWPQPGMAPTRDGFKQFVTSLRTAFPDLRYTIDDSFETGDRYVARVTASGTMRGEFAGMPATNKHATWNEIHIARVVNQQIVEHWGLIQELPMLVQLGVIDAPGRTLVTA